MTFGRIKIENKSGVAPIVIIVIIFMFAFLLLFVVSLVVSTLATKFGETPAEIYSTGAAPGSCALTNDGFSATNTPIKSADIVVQKLGSVYPILKDKKEQLGKIITKSIQAGINPALPIAIWGAEQTFENDEKAFGCGVYDKDKDGDIDQIYKRFDDEGDKHGQIWCVLEQIGKAMKNEPPYNKPPGANYFTRLFYTYTGEMKQFYEMTKNRYGYGYVADEKNNRIKILKMLVPEQVQCQGSPSERFANGSIRVPILLQCQQPWRDTPVGFNTGKGTVCDAGCGLTSAAMIVRYFKKNSITPVDIAGQLGDYPEMKVSTIVAKNDLKLVEGRQVDSTIKQFPSWIPEEIKNGHPILWRIEQTSGGGYITNSGTRIHNGHYMVIVGTVPKKNGGFDLVVNDPSPPGGNGSMIYSTDLNRYRSGFRFWTLTKE